MEVRQRSLMTGILAAALLVAPMAEAKRAGSGKNQGMSRQAAPAQSYQQPRQAAPAQQPVAPATAPVQQKSGPGVGGMVAAGVAGAAIGAVAANALADDTPASQAASQAVPAEEEGGIPGWIWILLAAAAAFFIFRKFGAKKKVAPNPYAPNHGANNAPFGQVPPPASGDNANIFGQNVGGSTPQNNAPFGQAPQQAPVFGSAYTNSGSQLPDGTEPAAFLRIARQRFNHIQSMNNASNVNEIQRYLTPDLYQSMYNDIMANQDHDVAEFSNLNAMVTDSTTENGQYIVSVRFTGTVSEDLNSLPQPFTEIWHFVKPAGSDQDWLVAGIQQES
ncbi:TIM44-like domain-containing protein [uncultured Acinetobacter sp.]|uniref:TIM44-like domain-containing protein n=1 Tax=uncultured Acinetobacter sp. TaxID=165433 RepID=UPI002620E248|nr:TIM44-like domain-containing protein [uncultured Acinetobacter sp.]